MTDSYDFFGLDRSTAPPMETIAVSLTPELIEEAIRKAFEIRPPQRRWICSPKEFRLFLDNGIIDKDGRFLW